MKRISVMLIATLMSFTVNAAQINFICYFFSDTGQKQSILEGLGLQPDMMFSTIYFAFPEYQENIVASLKAGTFNASTEGVFVGIPYKEVLWAETDNPNNFELGHYVGQADWLNGYEDLMGEEWESYNIFTILYNDDGYHIYNDFASDPLEGCVGEGWILGWQGWWGGNWHLAQTVPEPSTVLLALSGIALFLRRHRKPRHDTPNPPPMPDADG